MINVFKYLDYRIILHEKADEERFRNRSFTYAEFASRIRIQPSYLSRVFRKEAHLNGDQLYLACESLPFSEDERKYLFLLLEWGRCELVPRKQTLKKEISDIQNRRRGSEHHLTAEFVKPELPGPAQDYYLDPWAPLIHSFLTVEKYRRNPELITSILRISVQRLQEILELLRRLGIIAFDDRKRELQILKDHLHLDRASPVNRAYQSLFRQAALGHLGGLDDGAKFQFSVTLSTDEETRQFIHDEFNAFLRRVEPQVRSSPAEFIYQLNFDLFRWDV